MDSLNLEANEYFIDDFKKYFAKKFVSVSTLNLTFISYSVIIYNFFYFSF